MPAVLRARCRLRPRRPVVPGRPRRRRVRRQRFEDLVERGPPRQARHPDRPHRSRPAEAQGHLVLHLSDGPAGHHDEPDRRHDDGALVQPGVLRRRPDPGLAAGRRRERRLAARQGHAVERTGVAVVGRIAVGCRPVGRRTDRPDPARRPARRPRAARSRRPTAHRGDAAPPQPDAQPVGDAQGQDARPGGVDPEDHGRRARPARDVPRQGSRRRGRHARRIRPGRQGPGDDARAARPRTGSPDERRRPPVRRRRPDLALRLPVPPGADARRRNVRRAAQHRRRTRPRPAA